MDKKMAVTKLNLFYGNHQALFDVSIDAQEHQVLALIGPSGCGKSTFLRTLNRMNDRIDGVRIEGDISLDGEDIYAKDTDLTLLRRRVAWSFSGQIPFPCPSTTMWPTAAGSTA